MKNKLFAVLSFLAFHGGFGQQIAGSWMGELDIQGAKLPLIIHIKSENSSYSATMDSPMQGAEGIPLDKTSFVNNELIFEKAQINASYKGILKDSIITGTFAQNGMTLPLTLKPLKKNIQVLKISSLEESIRRVDNLLTYLEQNNILAGEISIFKGGKEVFSRNFGEKNLPDFKESNKVFQIGSISKTMTAVMIFKLIENKKLNLNDTLALYFPEIPNAGKITIAQLLHHSSGLGDYVMGKDGLKWLTKKVTDRQITERIREQGTAFEPGAQQQYSNSGYYLLTKILAKVSKKTYAENLNEHIIRPLRLKDFYTAGQKPSNVYPPFVYQHRWNAVTDFNFENIVGVGDIATTPHQLNTIINALFGGKLVSEESLQEMMPEDRRFGKGLAMVPFYGKIFVGHSGGTFGTHSAMIYNGEDDLSVSYSLNADRNGLAGNEFIVGVLSLLYGMDYDFPKVHE